MVHLLIAIIKYISENTNHHEIWELDEDEDQLARLLFILSPSDLEIKAHTLV